MEFKDHALLPDREYEGVLYENQPLQRPNGEIVEGLHAARVTLNNPKQYNSYTTEMIKGVIAGMRRASDDRACVAVVFTGAGHKAFCSGGNTAEYATYYAGRPEEYRQYMRLFNDMVSAILHCDKPVVCRANGMRIGGGQEIGMACDFTVAQDLALFGQAGPKHGSAPDGGSTDFLPLFVGIEAAMESCTLCQPWTAHKAKRLGLIGRIIPALKVNGEFVPNPRAITDQWIDSHGEIVYGEPQVGDAARQAKEAIAAGEVDLSLLDREVDALVYQLAMTMPGCLSKTVESMRKHKLEHWDRNRETNRAWLGLNMMTEGRAGFRAFHEGSRECREPDFLLLRQRLAEGAVWGEELVDEILRKAHGKETVG
ncbi:MAG: 6-oxocyclohex-1-ene-1-carbonyl-CoA hydratase [Acidobacteriota bacterium]|nr:6-oxocyclohex-1-ene-1-carbonyl-CoA hydratase [Acidobacteriota bacterium]MDH3786003.1 6-oxocyclohex-1-ene-1-carbonyl-CoA hydratase [Acidobacteriota bacterium]